MGKKDEGGGREGEGGRTRMRRKDGRYGSDGGRSVVGLGSYIRVVARAYVLATFVHTCRC